MNTRNTLGLALLGVAVVLSGACAAAATDVKPFQRPTPEQMKAVHECAAKQGVDLPEPPKGQPPKAGAGQQDGQRMPHPRLTEEQRKIVRGCFEAQGLQPPPHGPHHGRMMQGEPPKDAGAPPSED